MRRAFVGVDGEVDERAGLVQLLPAAAAVGAPVD
jgi:hypothetical protein